MNYRIAALGLIILAGCSRESASHSVTPGLEEFIEGANRVAIGMTESEVDHALGAEPSQRKGSDVEWQLRQRNHPGVAIGSFVDGYLVAIKFSVSLDSPALPRIGRSVADALTQYDVVTRAIAGQLTLRDVESTTGVRGSRATWQLAQGQGPSTRTFSNWVWEISPGGKLLIVSEEDGKAGQPYVRDLQR